MLVVDYLKYSWQELVIELGWYIGLECQVQVVIQCFDVYIVEVVVVIVLLQGLVSVVGYNIVGSYFIGCQVSFQVCLFEVFGFQVVELLEVLVGKVMCVLDFQFILWENLFVVIVGDSVFLFGVSDDDVQVFFVDLVLVNLLVVCEKCVYVLGFSFFCIDYYLGWQMIDNVVCYFC